MVLGHAGLNHCPFSLVRRAAAPVTPFFAFKAVVVKIYAFGSGICFGSCYRTFIRSTSLYSPGLVIAGLM